jgi:hypothetical protein
VRYFDLCALSFFDVLLVSGNNAPLTAVVVMQFAICYCRVTNHIISKATLVLAGFGNYFFALITTL